MAESKEILLKHPKQSEIEEQDSSSEINDVEISIVDKSKGSQSKPTDSVAVEITPVHHGNTVKDLVSLVYPPPMNIEFININAWVDELPGAETNKKQILFDVCGEVQPGELLAIMGPSGAGKSSLLNTLGGRHKDSKGQILINGQPRTKSAKRKIGYVLQADVMMGKLTVRETLMITARLRLPRTMTIQEKESQVDSIIQLMGLEKCVDTLVEAVSGGEKKRISIANEILINPGLLLLDEPTSGLDSTTAMSILTTLEELAAQGRTIVCVIHQPSSQMFQKFNKLMLMANGYVVYHGVGKDAIQYMSDAGYPCPNHFNPADFLLEVITEDVRAEGGEKESIKILTEKWKIRSKMKKDVEQISELNDGVEVSSWQTTWWEQFQILAFRSFKQKRGASFTKLQVFNVSMTAIICGLIWWRTPHVEESITAYTGIVFFLTVWISFYSMFQAVMTFPAERPVIRKERQSGSYRLSAFYFAKIFSESPVEFFFPVIAALVIYWATGLNDSAGPFFLFLLVTCVGVAASTAFGTAIGCSVMDMERSIVLMSVIGLAFMLLGGYFVQDNRIPKWIAFLRYLSPMKYVFNGAAVVVIRDLEFTCAVPSKYNECKTSSVIKGNEILSNMGIETNPEFSVGMLFVLMFAYRIVGYIFLRKNTA